METLAEMGIPTAVQGIKKGNSDPLPPDLEAMPDERIDADVLAWFEARGPGHITRMNQALRPAMLGKIRRRMKGEAVRFGNPRGGRLSEAADLPHA
jgi:hypothetical protein